MFCQHVAGYVGSNVTRRGQDVEAVWTIAELADLFQEWVVVCWQTRPHDGLRSPFLPGRVLSPNDVCMLSVSRSGHLSVCLSGDDCIELLPIEWRKINDYGITIGYRTYDCRELGPYRRQRGMSYRRRAQLLCWGRPRGRPLGTGKRYPAAGPRAGIQSLPRIS
ncbi:hypothetical protein [Streptomyces jumonjinensis]|uniref:hypothetical protein n=1 Tax=Streptomyces jumonjinensis TaxID=1945 RepID=UPI001E4D2A49|nr:hypothetical protein [Streptomyces jumonjinensis]